MFMIPLVVVGCRQQKSSTIIARVGDAELTLEEARTRVDTTHGSITHQLQDYVSYWVNTELVYQEAKRHGVENSDQVHRQLEDIKRQLVNQAFLEQQVFADTAAREEQALHDYYTAHAPEFFVQEDMIKLNMIIFNDRASASTFAAAVSRGGLWNTAVQHVLQDVAASSGVVSFTANQYYTQHTLFPPELWKVAAALNINEVTFPVKTSLGYYVIQALSRRKQGAPADFDLVKDEVRHRLLLERRRTNYTELLGTLRKRYNVEVLMGADTSGDTVRVQVNE